MACGRDVRRVVDSLPGVAGYLGHRLGAAEDFPQTVDAFTFSLWESYGDARAWVYRSGVHARAMHDQMQGTHVQRGTFTVFAVLETAGAWSGLVGPVHARLPQWPAQRNGAEAATMP